MIITFLILTIILIETQDICEPGGAVSDNEDDLYVSDGGDDTHTTIMIHQYRSVVQQQLLMTQMERFQLMNVMKF